MTAISRFGELRQVLMDAPLLKTIGPLEAGGYYRIIRILEREPSRLLNYEEVRDQVADLIKENNKREYISSYMTDLRQQHPVSIDSERLMALRLAN